MTGQGDAVPGEGTAAHPLGVAVGLLRADAPRQIVSNPESWPRWQVLLPHVLAATAHTDQAGITDTAVLDDSAWLPDAAGTYPRVHARLAEARALEERALNVDEAAYGPDHPRFVGRLNNLAAILRVLGELDKARALEARASAIRARRTEH